MNSPPPFEPASRRVSRLLWGVVLTASLLALAFMLGVLRRHEAPRQALPDYGAVAEFMLTNQDGQAVSLRDLAGKVWVADIIFTRCPGPCLKMTQQMRDLQNALPQSSSVKLVSLTTDPDFDTPKVLKTYAQRFGADPSRWLFLTGAKRQIAALAIDSLKLTALEKNAEERQSPNDLFVHSTIFVAVDKHSHLRGIFETSGEDVDPAQARGQILATVTRLESEP
ncbi:MAG TPA: SCO family protein [Verrucomicrobiae bacterium]|nr:SCO family protein [Verrucomicrobiae bacterium]